MHRMMKMLNDAEVEWIRSDGNAYIDTGVKWDTALPFDMTWYQFTKQGFLAFLGARDVASAGAGYYFGGAGTPTDGVYRYHIDMGGVRTNTVMAGYDGYWYNAKYTGNSIQVIRLETGAGNTVSFSPPQRTGARNILVTAVDNAGTINKYPGIGIQKLVLGTVRDMISVRFTNEQGVSEGAMYDRVSGRLFRNAGTGAFTIGPDKT